MISEQNALLAFSALSQETRLRIVRMLVVAGAEGLAAGAIAEKVAVSPSNVSFHLKELEHAGLIVARRESRSIIYAADYAALSGLLLFLTENCCAGQPEICGPVVQALACAPAGKTKERTC
ncbi:ArsR/SmtB family transcription factor [Rhizobium sp. NRK18]|uniref:ArsR/SmtB family transcription factor n=1 Tax=Rhizobium sp. NRK18 TaxID=2964667 RepID=UPI003965C601